LNKPILRYISLVIFFVVAIVFELRNYVMDNGIRLEFLWLSYGPLTIFFVVILNWVLDYINPEKLYKSIRDFINNLGAMSFEIYMVHVWIYRVFSFYGIWTVLGGWSYLAMPVLEILTAVVFKKLIDKTLIVLHIA